MGRSRKTTMARSTVASERAITRAVGYIRVSSDGQATDGFSLADQRKRIAAHASAQGWDLIRIFEDAGASGKSADREALSELLAGVAAHNFDAVIVVKLDRLTRSLADLLSLSETLDRAGVALVSLKESIDTSTPVGRLFRNILGSLAEFERETIIDRITSGQREKAAQGKRVGARVPYGYALTPSGSTVINEQQAAVVRRIFSERDAGLTLSAITDGLNDDAVPSPTGKKWSISTVAKVRENAYYAGKVRWGGEWTSATDHEPIVPADTAFPTMAA